MDTTAKQLDNAVKLVCPIFGVSIGTPNDRDTWTIQYKPEATAEEKAAALAIIPGLVIE
jgi:hypothetical protein